MSQIAPPCLSPHIPPRFSRSSTVCTDLARSVVRADAAAALDDDEALRLSELQIANREKQLAMHERQKQKNSAQRGGRTRGSRR
jgi:hypothetical protein